LAAWLALNAALAIARPGLATLEADTLWEARPFWALLAELQAFAALLLAVRVVQIDPLVGTTAAWRTMPLSRGPFLWAKLLLIAAAVAGGPALSDCIPAAAVGLRFQDVALAGVFGVAGLSSWAALGVLVGATTRSFRQAVLTCLAAVFAVRLFSGFMHPRLGALALPFGSSWSLQQSQWMASNAVLVVCAIVVFIHQQTTSRLERSRVLAGLALLLTLVVGATFRWDVWHVFTTWARASGESRNLDPESLVVEFEPGQGVERTVGRRPAAFATVSIAAETLRVSGLPDGAWAEVVEVSSTTRFSNGTTLRFDGWPSAAPEGHEAGWGPVGARAASISRALDLKVVAWPGPYGYAEPPRAILVQSEEPMFGHLSQFPARLTADLRLQAYRYRVASRGPARRGTHLRASGVSSDVSGVELAPDASVEVRLRLGLIQRSTGPLPTVALTNTDRRLAVLYPLQVGRGPWRPALEMYGGAFVMAGLTVQFRSGEFGPHGRWTPASGDDSIDQAFLDGAELVLLEPEYLGTFTKRVEVADYRLRRARPVDFAAPVR